MLEAPLSTPEEEEDDSVYCPDCGGYGGESYGSDSGTCETCDGTGYVSADYFDGGEEE